MRGERENGNSGGARNGYRSRSRSPPPSSYRGRDRSRSRERSYERDRGKRTRSRSPEGLHKRNRSSYPPPPSSGGGQRRSRSPGDRNHSNGRNEGGGRGGGWRGGRGGRGGRGRGRGGGDGDSINFVDLRVEGPRKKADVKVGADYDAVGEPEETIQTNMKEEEITEESLQQIEEFLLNEEETEEERELRLIAERRKRREEILQKHSASLPAPPEQLEPVAMTPHVSVIDTPLAGSQDPVIEKDDEDEDERSSRLPVTSRDVDVENEAAALMAEREAVAAAEKRETISFDIFSSSPTTTNIPMKPGTLGKRVMKNALLEGEDPLLQSNWDDGEGYYKTRIGEIICDRYRTMGEVGKGVFSTVLKCLDLRQLVSSDGDSETHPQVILKVIRNNDLMRKASEKELQLLTLISRADPEGKKHCVRMISNSDFRNHIVIVFEPLSMNLRETLKKFGKNVGINVTAVRMYARQLFVALRHLSDLRIVHADIKPDNIVVSEDLKTVKLCDFGSAFLETDSGNDPTPYLVSRFYRAPEIILALPYDRNIDLWSVGVCLYELFTGHVMFPGRTNNEMLKLMMETKGKVPNKLIKASIRQYESMAIDPHFDSDMKFKLIELDPVTGKPVMRLVDFTSPTKDLSTILLSSKAGADDRSLVAKLTDLLEKCLALDPAKRIKVTEALKHQLFQTSHPTK